MKREDLLKIISSLPEGCEICVPDSYGAFHDYNDFNGIFTKKLYYKDDNTISNLYILDTDGTDYRFISKLSPDYDKYSDPDDKHIKKLLSVIGGENYYYDSKSTLADWEPKGSGGTPKDGNDLLRRNQDYWCKFSMYLDLPVTEIKHMSLSELGSFIEKKENNKDVRM